MFLIILNWTKISTWNFEWRASIMWLWLWLCHKTSCKCNIVKRQNWLSSKNFHYRCFLTYLFKALPADQSQPTSSGYANYYAARWLIGHCKYMSRKTIAFWAMMSWYGKRVGKALTNIIIWLVAYISAHRKKHWICVSNKVQSFQAQY